MGDYGTCEVERIIYFVEVCCCYMHPSRHDAILLIVRRKRNMCKVHIVMHLYNMPKVFQFLLLEYCLVLGTWCLMLDALCFEHGVWCAAIVKLIILS